MPTIKKFAVSAQELPFGLTDHPKDDLGVYAVDLSRHCSNNIYFDHTALRASFFKQTGTLRLAHNMQARPWSLVSVLALLQYNKLVVFVSNLYVQS